MDFGGIATMGGGGPMISGNWINSKTGETVTVRDSFMDGEDMVIMLTNGRQLTLSDFQDYVQMSEEEYDQNGHMISQTNGGGIQNNAKPQPQKPAVDAATIFAGMDEDKAKEPAVTLTQEDGANELEKIMNGTSSQQEQQKVSAGQSEGMQAASKVIHRASSPIFKVSVEWPEFPKNELQMCKDYFDTTDDEITKAIIGMHCTGHELEAAITEWLIKAMK